MDPAGPCGPEPRLGLKPKDTGKVKQKSNLGLMLQFQSGKSRISARAEIVQVVSKNTCNLWNGLALPHPCPAHGCTRACGVPVSRSEERKPWTSSENMKMHSS